MLHRSWDNMRLVDERVADGSPTTPTLMSFVVGLVMFLFQLVWFRHTWEEGVTVDIGRPYPSPCTMPIQGEGGLRPIELTFTKDQVWAIGQCTSAYAIPRAVLPFHSLRDRGPLVPRNHARAPNLGLLFLAAPPPPPCSLPSCAARCSFARGILPL